MKGVDEIVHLDGRCGAPGMTTGILCANEGGVKKAAVEDGVCGQTEDVEEGKVEGEPVRRPAAIVMDKLRVER